MDFAQPLVSSTDRALAAVDFISAIGASCAKCILCRLCPPTLMLDIGADSLRRQLDLSTWVMPGRFGRRSSWRGSAEESSCCAMKISIETVAGRNSSPRCWKICDGSAFSGRKGRTAAGRADLILKASDGRFTSARLKGSAREDSSTRANVPVVTWSVPCRRRIKGTKNRSIRARAGKILNW